MLPRLVFAAVSLISFCSSAFGACEANVWHEYQGTKLWRFPGNSAYFYTVDHMEIDADGAPNAYHPNDSGVDALANAGYPDGGWRNVLVVDPEDSSKPYTQKVGQFAGYFESMTSLQNRSAAKTDIRRYVDATKIPYIVFPGGFYSLKGTGGYGDFLLARRIPNGEMTTAIIADGGPSDAPLGEVSIALAEKLGGTNVSPRNGSGAPKGTVVYVVFPGSKNQPSWPVSAQDFDVRGTNGIRGLGGWERILACAPSQ